MKKFIALSETISFSVGYRWYYWEKYKKMQTLPKDETSAINFNDHSGYHVSDLFVEKKYENFKEEVMAYEHISMDQWLGMRQKANNFLKTERVKKARPFKQVLHNFDILHYDIPADTPLNFWNLVALLLYTDYSAHCRVFSASFRRLSPFEPLEVTKERNRNFWWMSKTLRETVELHGQSRKGDVNPDIEKYQPEHRLNKQLGPFYCGVNRVMVLPQFNLRLCAPTSTTMQILVAMKFAGPNGSVIQLNNNSGGDFDDLRCFDVSWLSRFPDEDERLFIGGFWRIRVETVRLIKTRQNFQTFIHPLFYFDAMVTANVEMKELKISKKQIGIIQSLIKWKLGQKSANGVDEYLIKTFEGYTENKQQIEINLFYLSMARKSMAKFIVHSLKTRKQKIEDENRKVNLLQPGISQIFPNVKTVHINAGFGLYQYQFSLLAFLKLIQMTKWQQVIIKAEGSVIKDWIFYLWASEGQSIRNKYDSAGYDIDLLNDADEQGLSRLEIKKMEKPKKAVKSPADSISSLLKGIF